MSDTIHLLASYQTSRHYPGLIGLMRQHGIVCVVDYGETGRCRDIAKTIYAKNEHGETFRISARGICYVDAITEEDFLNQCKIANVEFLTP